MRRQGSGVEAVSAGALHERRHARRAEQRGGLARGLGPERRIPLRFDGQVPARVLGTGRRGHFMRIVFRVGRSEAERRATHAFVQDLTTFWRRTWVVWVIAAVGAVAAAVASR